VSAVPPRAGWPANVALRELGVRCSAGADELTTLGLDLPSLVAGGPA